MTYDGIYSRSKLVNKLIWLKATYCDVCVCGTYVHVAVVVQVVCVPTPVI